jgi:cyclopropane-fatty-acyl-phospholipid synthase
MPVQAIATMRDQAVQNSLDFLEALLGHYHLCDFAVRVWDGSTWNASPRQQPRCTLVLQHEGALRRMFWPPNQLTLGEAYIHGDFDIEGDFGTAFTLADCLSNRHWGWREKLRFGRYLLSLPELPRTEPAQQVRPRGRLHSLRRDAQAISYHYDLSPDFYRLWLDEGMTYSCAYFDSAGEDLETAQKRKLDYICRKLRLKAGERLLDIGCGWGGLVLHAARHYGVEAHGITLSRSQAAVANDRIRRAGLSDRCHVEVLDYREVQEPYGFDKLVSVGMFEHVGEDRLPDYFAQAWRLLRPGGVFLNHGISSSLAHPLPDGPSFIDRYVFPDFALLPVTDTLRLAEMTGFEVRDLESLREHYSMTLDQWVLRLEKHREKACRITNEMTYRTWRLYMAGCSHAFKLGQLNIYQALLSKPEGGCNKLPLTRCDWYQ